MSDVIRGDVYKICGMTLLEALLSVVVLAAGISSAVSGMIIVIDYC